MHEPWQQHLDWFATLSPATLVGIATVYTETACFRDPFQQVTGLAAIRAVYARMFQQLEAPRFVIDELIADGDRAFVSWNFHFAWRGRAHCIHGGSRFRLAPDGRIADHRDYWDAAEGVYEQLPGLGWLLRRLKRRLA